MLIVGAGPAGLVAAITLAGYGVDVLLVEQRDGVSRLSRTLVISTRGMELMRRWGIEDAVRAGAADVRPRAWVTAALASGDGHEMPLGYPSDEEAAAVSPSRPAWAPQDHHEPLLLGRLREAPHARVEFGVELVDLTHDGDDVVAVLRDRKRGTSREVRAAYAIGADGARSAVRQRLGITMQGPDDLADYERVEFLADLDAEARRRPYALYVVTEGEGAGVLARRGRGHRWSLSRERSPSERRFSDLGEAEVVALLRSATGVRALNPHVEGYSTFAFAAQMAERYREGRGFLIGDAAHRMTPRGGTGMNTAIQDGFDLGWKMGWVLRGWAPADLLDSYEAERRPVAAHNVGRAGEPAGARRATADALPWDLNGRVAHHWLRVNGRRVSTVDLLGDGLTVFAGGQGGRSAAAAAAVSQRAQLCAPLAVHTINDETAAALGVAADGALLLRPDGRELARLGAGTVVTDRGG